jgi:hypothetical protein
MNTEHMICSTCREENDTIQFGVYRAGNHILNSRAPHYNELSCLPSLFGINVLLHMSV